MGTPKALSRPSCRSRALRGPRPVRGMPDCRVFVDADGECLESLGCFESTVERGDPACEVRELDGATAFRARRTSPARSVFRATASRASNGSTTTPVSTKVRSRSRGSSPHRRVHRRAASASFASQRGRRPRDGAGAWPSLAAWGRRRSAPGLIGPASRRTYSQRDPRRRLGGFALRRKRSSHVSLLPPWRSIHLLRVCKNSCRQPAGIVDVDQTVPVCAGDVIAPSSSCTCAASSSTGNGTPSPTT